jgi:hypothetical protein
MRCGRLACHLVLFLFDSIMKKNIYSRKTYRDLKFQQTQHEEYQLTADQKILHLLNIGEENSAK